MKERFPRRRANNMKGIGDEYCRVFHLIRLELNSLRNLKGKNKQTNKTSKGKSNI